MKGLGYLLLVFSVFGVVMFLAQSGTRGSPSDSAAIAETNPTVASVPTWTATFTAEQAAIASRTPTPVPSTPTPKPPPSITIDKLMNVRGGPGTNYKVIGQANVGDQFRITGKNPGLGDWWQINYNGRTGWVYGDLVSAQNANTVQVALVIPAPPPSAPTARPVVRVTNTPRPVLTQRCTFAGTEPRVPDPIGLAVYDCEAWDMAYFMLTHDRPEVTFASFNNSVRLDMTHLVYNLLRQAILNCSTDLHVLVGLVMVTAEQIENHGSPRDVEILNAPRTAVLGGLNSISGGKEVCYSTMDEWLKYQLRR